MILDTNFSTNYCENPHSSFLSFSFQASRIYICPEHNNDQHIQCVRGRKEEDIGGRKPAAPEIEGILSPTYYYQYQGCAVTSCSSDDEKKEESFKYILRPDKFLMGLIKCQFSLCLLSVLYKSQLETTA